jgi:hypothetical protein
MSTPDRRPTRIEIERIRVKAFERDGDLYVLAGPEPGD